MSPDGKNKWPSTATQEYTVLRPVRQNAYLVVETDWIRIERMVGEIIPHKGGFQVVASISVGVLVSALSIWISFKVSDSTVPNWAWTADTCAIWCSLLMAISFFVFDSKRQKSTVRTVRSVQTEMAEVRKRCGTEI